MLNTFLRFATWPAAAGLLAAVIILQTGLGFKSDSGGAATGPYSYSVAVERAAPSVVNIYTTNLPPEARRNPLFDDPRFRQFYNRQRVQQSLGSGVIVSADGLILTNRHVIADAIEILVLLHDGREAIASVVGSDADTDLALLRINSGELQPMRLGQPDQARVGDVVLAIGNPFGFGHSVSQGIISALGRYGLNLSRYEDFIQTDAAINLGNSGGALIDAEGRLLGINTATWRRGASGDQALGIGLATPADLALDVVQDLLRYGKVIRGWMGLEVRVLSESPLQAGPQQLEVVAIEPSGPAARAGVKLGDIIVEIDRRSVLNGRETMHQIAMLRPGDKIAMRVQRNTTLIDMDAVVGVRPGSE